MGSPATTPTILAGDCLDVIRTLPDCSIDAVVTDPPYALIPTGLSLNTMAHKAGQPNRRVNPSGFMGAKWDTGEVAFSVEFWREVLRVLKPGGHVVSFGGSRTYHRMACAIEDAGFEIRDQLQWITAQGFPKNHAVNRSPMFCQCGEVGRSGESKDRGQSPGDRTDKPAAPLDDAHYHTDAQRSIGIGLGSPAGYPLDYHLCDGQPLQTRGDGQACSPSQQYAQGHIRSSEFAGVRQPGSLHSPSPVRHISPLSSPGYSHLAGSSTLEPESMPVNTSRADTSELQSRKLGMDRFSSPSYGNGFPCCQVCGKPIADGFGSALKPSHEPICLARKPLSEATIAANVLRWGTGALNIDATRVGVNPREICVTSGAKVTTACHEGYQRPGASMFNTGKPKERSGPQAARWPANVLHDGSPEVVAMFPAGRSAGNYPSDSVGTGNGVTYMPTKRQGQLYADSGSAARFFYSAKASKADRAGSRHPTVKPVSLMRWLVRLVTQPGGTILDPFAGSGTTGAAALAEGFNCILIEREAEYLADIRRRFEPSPKPEPVALTEGLFA